MHRFAREIVVRGRGLLLAAVLSGAAAGCGGGGGSGNSLASAVDLYDVGTGVDGFAIFGDARTRIGTSIAGAGDVNGDGLDDVVIGSPLEDLAAATDVGRTYVAFGRPDGATIDLDDLRSGIGGFVIDGINAGDQNGYSVAAAGDVNNDGYGDLIIGMPYGVPPFPLGTAGEAWIIFGKPDTAPVSLASIAAQTGGGFLLREIFFIYSIHRIGSSVSGAGDVNGDGLDDVVVGAQLVQQASSIAYIVFGKSSFAIVNTPDLGSGSGGFTIQDPTYAYSQSTVSGAGDVNGDGLADVLLLVHDASDAYVVFGKSDTANVELAAVSSGTGGFPIIAETFYQGSFGSGAGAGDVNGDGLDDLIIGAPNAEFEGFDNVGRSYVIFGKADTGAVSLDNVVAGVGGFVVIGHDPGDQSGGSVASANDVNGDGLDDVIIGALGGETSDIPEDDGQGLAYLVWGKEDTGPVLLEDVERGQGGLWMYGGRRADTAGSAVGPAGDFNGDGFYDVWVSAPGVGPSIGSSPGALYVVSNPFAP